MARYQSPQQEIVINQLKACPVWGEARGRQRTGQLVMESIRKIARHPPDALREAIEDYCRVSGINGEPDLYDEPDTHRWRKVYILNRYLFDVPEKGKGCPPYFGSFIGEASWPGMMWPLAFDKSGMIALQYSLSSYAGPPYRGVEEFDHFLKVYGLRTLFEKGP